MPERRICQRRQQDRQLDFPCHLASGEYIESDRRRLPDRRLGDIAVEEITCEDFILTMSRET